MEANKKIYIVMYHYVRELKSSRYSGIKGLDYQLFKEQIEFLKKHFTIITMEQAIEAWNSKIAGLPENAMLLTFDDGYIDNFTFVFPILKKHRLQGSFFIPGEAIVENKLLDVNKVHFTLASAEADSLVKDVFQQLDSYRTNETDLPSNEELFQKYAVANRFDSKEIIFIKRMLQTALPEQLRNQISSNLFKKYVGIEEDVFAKELYLNRDQIKCMKDEGMFIGLHGYAHYWLGNLDEIRMKNDIDRALETMDEFIDRNNWVLNYPYGSYNEMLLDYISQKGCKLGMTTQVGMANLDRDSRYLLPRLDCNDFPPKSENYIAIGDRVIPL